MTTIEVTVQAPPDPAAVQAFLGGFTADPGGTLRNLPRGRRIDGISILIRTPKAVAQRTTPSPERSALNRRGGPSTQQRAGRAVPGSPRATEGVPATDARPAGRGRAR